MENYNWIKARYVDFEKERDIVVRQLYSCRNEFVDKDGNHYGVTDLDFTQAPALPDFMKSFEESNKRFEEQNKEREEMYMKMLSSMDANAIADHKAKIDEREYWRKLRGEIFASVCNYREVSSVDEALDTTTRIMDALYNQDKDFFKDK